MLTYRIIKHTYTLWYQVVILTANVSKLSSAARTGHLPWARGQTACEQRRLTAGPFPCRALLCHYHLKLLILWVQNFAAIWRRGLSRRDLPEDPSGGSQIIVGDPVSLCAQYQVHFATLLSWF